MINIEELVKAIGIKHVKVIDPNNLKEVDDAFDAFMELDEPSVIITRWPCVLKNSLMPIWKNGRTCSRRRTWLTPRSVSDVSSARRRGVRL